MRNLIITLILLSTICLNGCEVTSHTYLPSSSVNFYGISLVNYVDEGFLITPMEYYGKYITTGIYEVEAIPEIKALNNGFIANPKFAKEYSAPEGFEKLLLADMNGNYWILGIEQIDMNKVVEDAYKFAKSSGGDAIVLFKTYMNSKIGYYRSIQFEYRTKSVSGVIIKRE